MHFVDRWVKRVAAEIKMRGLDLLNPIWNYLDLAPKRRGDFNARLEYREQSQAGGAKRT